ncbi:MAG: 4-hydroxythreonine-4-phosphate dehydrogenase PdxA [Verrucomicrobia bacterium]|nr:4-hydroxythreonine-4-phosphate dehydrogenase PdxA [Verrucomicrobiota bacterium]
MKRQPVVGITLGDVNGIGPEISLKAVKRRWPAGVCFVLIGSHAVVHDQCASEGLRQPEPWSPGGGAPRTKISVWDPTPHMTLRRSPGKIVSEASTAAIQWIAAGVDACLKKDISAMVTAPICKEGLVKAGLKMPGHTEYLAELTGTRRFAMMLIGGPLRVVLATRHIPVRNIAASLSKHVVAESIEMLDEGLAWLGAGRKIGVCGLNPHAGDGGAIGKEDLDIVRPAVQAAVRKGIRAEGPIPGDTIFYQALQGAYDGIVAMYHDQGLAPLKMLAFNEGVNITLGLPIIRTSPDHGTAFDLAGRGKANPASMIKAIELAIQLTGRRNPWRR